MAYPVGRDLETIFDKRYKPAYQDYPYEGFSLEFQMAVPRESHKYIRDRQKNDSFHKFCSEDEKECLL